MGSKFPTPAPTDPEHRKPPAPKVPPSIASLQRELAEARRHYGLLRDAVYEWVGRTASSFELSLYNEDAWETSDWELKTRLDCLEKERIMAQAVPGPSDAKGEARKFTTPTEPEMREYKVTVGPSPGGNYTAEVFGAGGGKSRPSLTPLTDPTVRGVLVDDGEPTRDVSRGNFYIGVDTGIFWCPNEHSTGRAFHQPVKLRPASEFGVPAEPAQKLVPLPEGVHAWVETGEVRPVVYGEYYLWRETGEAFYRDYEHPTDESFPIMRKLDTALYGVDAERVRELEAELAKLQKELAEWVQATNRQAGRANNAASDAERLRKAIDAAISELTDQGPYDRPKIINSLGYLWSALTPPTATPEVSASGEAECQCDIERGCAKGDGVRVEGKCTLELKGQSIVPPSAPAAESEGGVDWAGIALQHGDRIIRMEREAAELSARLAACEARCKELEAGIARHRHLMYHSYAIDATNANAELWSLLAPKAEGGKP